MGKLLFHWVPHKRLQRDRAPCTGPSDPTFATAEPAAVPASRRGVVVTASGEAGAAPSIGTCACLRRELSGEPDAGNLHLRFDEGRVGRAIRVALSPTLPARYGCPVIPQLPSHDRKGVVLKLNGHYKGPSTPAN